MAVSLSTERLGIVLELNGIINANLIAFVLPGACGAMLLPGAGIFRGERLAATLLCCFGIAVRQGASPAEWRTHFPYASGTVQHSPASQGKRRTRTKQKEKCLPISKP